MGRAFFENFHMEFLFAKNNPTLNFKVLTQNYKKSEKLMNLWTTAFQ